MTPRTVIANASPLLRDLLALACTNGGAAVLGTTGDRAQMLDLCRRLAPDVVVTGTSLSGGQLLEIMPELLATRVRVLVVADEAVPEVVASLLLAGAAGFLLTAESGLLELERAVHTVAQGHAALHPSAALVVLRQWRALRAGPEPLKTSSAPNISKRELDVLHGISDGLTTKAIARRLGVADKTVEAHKSRVFAKLGARTQAQAISLAVARGLLAERE